MASSSIAQKQISNGLLLPKPQFYTFPLLTFRTRQRKINCYHHKIVHPHPYSTTNYLNTTHNEVPQTTTWRVESRITHGKK